VRRTANLSDVLRTGETARNVRSSGIVDDKSAPEAGTANQQGVAPSLEPHPKLLLLANRAAAAGLSASWHASKYSRTKVPEGRWLRIEIPSGRRVREMNVHAEDAETVGSFKFEQWTALGDYQAILDTDKEVIIAEVTLSGFPGFGALPGVVKRSQGKSEPEPTHDAAMERAILKATSELGEISYLTIPAPNSRLSLELYSFRPLEIALLGHHQNPYGYGLTIRGVTTKRHDEALELLLDLTYSMFIDLDIAYRLRATLTKALDAELTIQDNLDPVCLNAAIPRFPSMLYDRDAASLFLYARNLIEIPLQEYLTYYQVIEFYLPTYTRSASIIRLRNILKDPSFDYNNDLTLGRLLDAIAPTGRKSMSEREQVAATIAYCVDDAAITAFLDDRPAAAKALADKNRIQGVRIISTRDRQTPLVSQVAERIYDLRCRIVHSKDSGFEAVSPIRPFDRESRLMRPDLSLIQFIAERILIVSGRSASW
jgi:hypothetical protein